MHSPHCLGKYAAGLAALFAAAISLTIRVPDSAADTASETALLTGRVTEWGGMFEDGDFRPPTFIVTGTSSRRAFFLSRRDESSSGLKAVDPADAVGEYSNLTAIRWLAGHASSDGSQLSDETEEDMAEQLAVWILAGAVPDSSVATDPSIGSRAAALVAESTAASARWTPPKYAQSYDVRIENRDEHTNTLRFDPKIVAEPQVPLANALFSVESQDLDEEQFSVTANRNGVGPPIGLREGTSPQSETLRAEIVLDPGVIFSDSSNVLVTAQTIPISRSTPVTVPAASLKRIGSIFDASLASNLTPAGRKVYWFAVAAASVLAAVGLLRFLAKLAETFNVKASGDPRAVRRRRWIFITACILFGAVLAPFSIFFVNSEFAAYGYRRPVDPQPRSPIVLLRPDQAWATSCFEPDALSYFPANVMDDDYTSAWVSARDRGAGSLLAFDFGQVVSINQLSVWNGVQGHGENMYANGRVTTLQLLSDGGWVQAATLDPDQPGEQVLGRDQDLFPIVTRYLVLRVGGLDDTHLNAALTEVRFYGHPLPGVARPGGISIDPAGRDIVRRDNANNRNTACHPR